MKDQAHTEVPSSITFEDHYKNVSKLREHGAGTKNDIVRAALDNFFKTFPTLDEQYRYVVDRAAATRRARIASRKGRVVAS